MRHNLTILCIAALSLFFSCNKMETIQNPDGSITVTASVSMAQTKALTNTGTKTFAVNDQLAVIYKQEGGGTAVAISEKLISSNIRPDGKSAKFRVTFTDPDKTKPVKYVYPANMAKNDGNINYDALYSEQDGTLAKIASSFDLCTQDVSWSGSSLPEGQTLVNQLTVAQFTLRDGAIAGDPGNITSSLTGLTVTNGSDEYDVTLSSNSTVWVAMKPITTGDIVFAATDGSNNYTKTVTGQTMSMGTLYSDITVSMTKTFPTPLTFEAMADGVTVKLHIFQTAQPSLQYRKNDGDWTTLTFVDSYNSTSISLNTGDKLSFKGDNTTLTKDQNGFCKFELSGNCYVYGNIMSLLDKDNFPTNKTLSAGFTFYELFLNAPIYNHPSKTLVLPATTLTASCYADMFAGCTHLTTAPALPAATLAASCYKNMFRGCTGLTTAPTLSATTLASECYRNMFGGCTSLTTAPALSATTMASDCYHEMFSGCTGLTTAPNLPATTLAENCYRYMFEDCTALETAPALPATTMANECYYAMFMGCTSLTTAPDLPATTLQYYCYSWMFDGCTKLNNVTCLATNISADNCTYQWLNGVAATGTFTRAGSMHNWTLNSANGIPSGWTVDPPVGALSGKFTISNDGGTTTSQVYFSQGNLQYQASTGTWRFAPNQYDAIGSGNSNVSPTYSGWIDSFGWGSGNQPTQTSENPSEYSTFVDWGTHAISNGGNRINSGWRTLESTEWAYLWNSRDNAANLLTLATVNNVTGLILMPDGWTASGVALTVTTANYTTNNINSTDWNTLEQQGCVFLPAGGYRHGTGIIDAGSYGAYWSSTSTSSDKATSMDFRSSKVEAYNTNRSTGCSVRLVCNAN